MTSPTLASYRDATELWQRALENPNGVKATCPDHKGAEDLRFRLYRARNQLRKESQKIHPPNSPEWGRSPYDSLIVKIIGTQLLIQNVDNIIPQIEDL